MPDHVERLDEQHWDKWSVLLEERMSEPAPGRGLSRAPWTSEQVAALNRYQQAGQFHPFTCGGEHDEQTDLVATEAGWVCPKDGCGYMHPSTRATSRGGRPEMPDAEGRSLSRSTTPGGGTA